MKSFAETDQARRGSWQIVPTISGELLLDKDAGQSETVMTAMLQMNKIDIKGLKQAYDKK
jgi:hypothetical protein